MNVLDLQMGEVNPLQCFDAIGEHLVLLRHNKAAKSVKTPVFLNTEEVQVIELDDDNLLNGLVSLVKLFSRCICPKRVRLHLVKHKFNEAMHHRSHVIRLRRALREALHEAETVKKTTGKNADTTEEPGHHSRYIARLWVLDFLVKRISNISF